MKTNKINIEKMCIGLPEIRCFLIFIHSFILNIYIAPLQEDCSEALPTPARLKTAKNGYFLIESRYITFDYLVTDRVDKNRDFLKKIKNRIFLFKSDFFYLNQI